MQKSKPMPPKWPIRILRWFCKPYYLEMIEGDLVELFERESLVNKAKARRKFSWSALKFFRLRFIKNVDDFKPLSSYGMYRNYLKVTLRSMRKHMSFALFNVVGLAVGVMSCLLLVVHINYQLSYDKHIDDVDQIYRIVNDRGTGNFNGWTPAPLAPQMAADFPEFEYVIRVIGSYPTILEIDGEFIHQDGAMSADPDFFEMFPTEFISGDPQSALDGPSKLVLTKSTSEKLFGTAESIGKTIHQDGEPFTVSAIVADPPKNTSVPYEFIYPLPEESANNPYWTGNNLYTFGKLLTGADLTGLELKFPDFVKRYLAPEAMEYLTDYETWEDFLADKNYVSYKMIPLQDVHLDYPRLDLGSGGSKENVIVFSIIALFILLIACINYINMSTARSSIRAKEIGMRKVLGSLRKSLVAQFLLESLIITLLAILVGVMLAILALPFFNQLTQMNYDISILFTWSSMLWILILVLVIGLIAGSYPAFFLSSFKPLMALKGENVSGGSRRLRTGLVVFQFAISIFLITGTFIVFQQVSHMSDRELGLNAEQIYVVKHGSKLEESSSVFRNELLSHPNVSEVSAWSHFPSGPIPDWRYKTVGENPVTIDPDNLFVDEYAQNALGLEIVTGKFFSGIASDTASVVVNQAFVKTAGWEEPIGEMVDRGEDNKFRVIGVVKDFVLRSGKNDIREVIFRNTGDISDFSFEGPYLHVRMNGDFQETLSFIESTWRQFVPGFPYDGFFLDDSFDQLYNSERRFGKLFTSFSSLAIILASIGLFALAAFTLERRTKELAIRKVLGATHTKVVSMIIWDFLKLILVGALLATPFVFYLGDDWLNNYDYRIQVNPMTFIVPIILVGMFSTLSIGYKSYIAAIDNPANALKQE